jgi:hypothetical protein
MALPTLKITDPPEDVLAEHVHCASTTYPDPYAAIYAPKFDALVSDWQAVNVTRIQLVINIARAHAKALQFDGQLDRFVDRLVLVLDKLTDKNRNDPLWYVYFKGEDPSVFKKPILAGQLLKMLVWPKSFNTSTQQELIDLEPVLAPLLPLAVAARDEHLAAKQALVDFDKVGAWRQHVDSSNAVRTDIYGSLLDIPNQNPAAKLPADYAEQFFLHDTSRRGAKKLKSSAELADEITAHQDDIKALEELRVEALAREAKEAADKATEEQLLKELADEKQKEKDAKDKQKKIKKDLKKK